MRGVRAGLGVILSLLLGACAHAPSREVTEAPATAPVDTAPETPPKPAPAVEKERPKAPEPITEEIPAPPPDLWSRVRDGQRFTSCDLSPRAKRWALVYTRQPERFAALLTRSGRFFPFVLDALAQENVPSEFVLLPVVESQYLAVRSRGNQPAGIWQFMPITAKSHGLTITRERDARLDPVVATRAAARLLKYLGEQFEGDWSLATMGFNAGEYRVRGALKKQAQRGLPRGHQTLEVNAITHDHLAKLTALNCVLRAPEQFGVNLPALDGDETLIAVTVPDDTDVDLLSLLSAQTRQAFLAVNAGDIGEIVPARREILIPARANERLSEWLTRLPASVARHWRVLPRRGEPNWTALAEGRVAPELLAELNALMPDAKSLLVPASASPAATTSAIVADTNGRYVVRSGDNPWLIARRLRLRLADLLSWNGLDARARLRPGQVLRTVEP